MSQEGIIDITGSTPSIPTEFVTDSGSAVPIANILEILGTTQAAGTSPLHTTGSGNTVTIINQLTQATPATDATRVGLAAFDSSSFAVDANGFVTLAGGGLTIDSIAVQTGTSPIVPTGAGLVTINGAVVAAGTNPIRTDGTGANTMAVEVQISQALAAADATRIGLSNFSSADFGVAATGFVTLSTTGAGKTITGDTGGALSPTANNWNILGSSPAAGTNPVRTTGAVSTLTVNVQKSQAIAATDATRVGLAAFDSSSFSVDANGFVTLAGGTQAIDSIHPDSGTDPVVPTAAGLVNIVGSGSTTTVGSLNTLTVQLTGLTNHAVLVGAGTTTITKVGPTATAGQVLQSAGASADPAFSTATYPVTTTVSQILYSSATNVVSGLATANRAVITTGTTGVPVATALATDGQLIIGSTAGAPAAATITAGTGISVTNGSNSITIAATGGAGIDTVAVQAFTSTGAFTYTPTSGMVYVIVELVGGGGGSGGVVVNQTRISGGAGGGAYARFLLTAAQVGGSLNGSVGAGGAGGAAGANAGNTGGSTTLATAAAWTVGGGALSGAGAAGPTEAGGAGGTVTAGTGTILHSRAGQAGGTSQTNQTNLSFSGKGGDSQLGSGGIPVVLNASTVSTAGQSGSGYGAGASGAVNHATTARAGGDGTNGIAIFTEYTT